MIHKLTAEEVEQKSTKDARKMFLGPQAYFLRKFSALFAVLHIWNNFSASGT
jgi:hypothetical protein